LKISKGLKIPRTVTANFVLKQPEEKKKFFAACFHAEGKENGKISLSCDVLNIFFAPTHPSKTGIYFLFDTCYDVFSIHL
jgi:hypothetical protein